MSDSPCQHVERIVIVDREDGAAGVITLYSCTSDQPAHTHFCAKHESRMGLGHRVVFPKPAHKEVVKFYNDSLKLTLERGFKIIYHGTERNYG